MARSLKKEWNNRQRSKRGSPYRTWTRRVMWYEDDTSVRLKFEDTAGVYNKTYTLPHQSHEAQADYERFRRGEPVEVWLGGRKTTTVPCQ